MASTQSEMATSNGSSARSTAPAQSEASTRQPASIAAEQPALTNAVPSTFGMMRRLAETMDRMFDDLGFGTLLRPSSRSIFGRPQSIWGEKLWSPEVEVQQREGQLVVRADLPGMNKEDLQLDVREGVLTIRGERRKEQQQTNAGVSYTERSYGTFTRSIPIPPSIRVEDVDAKFDNGVLEVTMQLPRQPGPRTIEIKSGSAASTPNLDASTTVAMDADLAAAAADSGSDGGTNGGTSGGTLGSS